MDITPVFGTVSGGSNPSESTLSGVFWQKKRKSVRIFRNKVLRFLKHCGHGLVVEHVLAKDETGVRFSLPAPFEISHILWMLLVKTVDNSVDYVGKRHNKWLIFIKSK